MLRGLEARRVGFVSYKLGRGLGVSSLTGDVAVFKVSVLGSLD